jgi:hypothetical protein
LYTDNSGLATRHLALTGSTVTEPLLLNPNDTLFTTNFNLNYSSPNIVYQDLSSIKLRDISSTIDTTYKYYIQSYLSDLSNYKLEINPYNFHATDFIKPKIRYWKKLIDYDNTKINVGDISSYFDIEEPKVEDKTILPEEFRTLVSNPSTSIFKKSIL